MGSAFPPDRMAECGLPYIVAIEGDLVPNCILCETTPTTRFNPLIPLPPPPSFDFGCYPFDYHVDFDPTPVPIPIFEVKLAYRNAERTLERPDYSVGYCKPKLKFKVRMGGGNGCGNIEVVVLADHNIVLSGCQTIDGIDVCTDDRVLTIAQTDKKENDVWIVQTGAWIRYETMLMCNTALVRFGDKHARTLWQMENRTEPTHGTDDILFSPIGNLTCRVAFYYTWGPLTGLYVVDGVMLAEGDWVLISRNDDLDGIYMASAGAWVRLYKIDPTLPDPVPTLSPGTMVTISEGYSFPTIFVVGQVS